MPDDQGQKLDTRAALRAAEEQVNRVVRGKEPSVRLCFAAVVAGGHVLLEDVPGVGKTTLARALAKSVGCSFSRVQFTSDLLPSDVIGVQVLDPSRGTLSFKKGPLFAHIVLADEINRASPKTQSALLEAMAERQVSVDDQTLSLEQPFCVIATQNPIEHHGAYPLPESQLDRFLVKMSLGYPPAQDEKALLMQTRTSEASLKDVIATLDVKALRKAQDEAAEVNLSEACAAYLLSIVEATRRHPLIDLGCSPRGALAWSALVKALAYLEGKAFVLPDHIKDTAKSVLVHRLSIRGATSGVRAQKRGEELVQEIVASVAAPR